MLSALNIERNCHSYRWFAKECKLTRVRSAWHATRLLTQLVKFLSLLPLAT